MQLSWQVNIRVSQIKSGSLIILKEHESSLSFKNHLPKKKKKKRRKKERKFGFFNKNHLVLCFFLRKGEKGNRKDL